LFWPDRCSEGKNVARSECSDGRTVRALRCSCRGDYRAFCRAIQSHAEKRRYLHTNTGRELCVACSGRGHYPPWRRKETCKRVLRICKKSRSCRHTFVLWLHQT